MPGVSALAERRPVVKITNNKKRFALFGTAAIIAGSSGAAMAYWTAGGSGTGSATTGTTQTLTAVQTSTLTALYPGDSPQTLSGNFNNPNNGPIYVTSVTASISSVTGGAGSCSAADYTLSNAVMAVGVEVPVGNAKGAWTGATIQFNNTGSNQDGCKGATVNFAYAIS